MQRNEITLDSTIMFQDRNEDRELIATFVNENYLDFIEKNTEYTCSLGTLVFTQSLLKFHSSTQEEKLYTILSEGNKIIDRAICIANGSVQLYQDIPTALFFLEQNQTHESNRLRKSSKERPLSRNITKDEHSPRKSSGEESHRIKVSPKQESPRNKTSTLRKSSNGSFKLSLHSLEEAEKNLENFSSESSQDNRIKSSTIQISRKLNCNSAVPSREILERTTSNEKVRSRSDSGKSKTQKRGSKKLDLDDLTYLTSDEERTSSRGDLRFFHDSRNIFSEPEDLSTRLKPKGDERISTQELRNLLVYEQWEQETKPTQTAEEYEKHVSDLKEAGAFWDDWDENRGPEGFAPLPGARR